jgi:hypothetical protein
LHHVFAFATLDTQGSSSLSYLTARWWIELLELNTGLLPALSPCDRQSARVVCASSIQLAVCNPEIPHSKPRFLVRRSAESTRRQIRFFRLTS